MIFYNLFKNLSKFKLKKLVQLQGTVQNGCNQIWKGTESTNKNYLKTCLIPSNSQVYRIKCLHQQFAKI